VFDHECRNYEKSKGCIALNLDVQSDVLTPLVDIVNVDTLHDKDPIIEWNEVYDESNMKPYPIKPLCVVHANMGLGQTVYLVHDFLPRICQMLINNISKNTFFKIPAKSGTIWFC
jgi:hypothetical protein